MLISRLQQQQQPDHPPSAQQQLLHEDKTFSWFISRGGGKRDGYGSTGIKKERSRWQHAARQGSLAATLQLAYLEDAKHDPQTTACQRCDAVAEHYLTALERTYHSEGGFGGGPVFCSADLLELVSQMCQMVLEHAFYQQDSWWFHPLTKTLWDFAKQLKDESIGSDHHVITTLQPASVIVTEDDNDDGIDDEQEAYRRAIRITVYHCRAHVYQRHRELERAAVYFRKCVAVHRPSSSSFVFETQRLLRESAKISLKELASSSSNQQHHHQQQRRGSISSNGSAASACAHCGKEKRAMPVCAKCRAMSYCSNRCLIADKPVHDKQCHRIQK
ncbi:hypothetical protein O0I10_009939 [Lichtheimia ornata]|uniref:MYND-type domain-containing protein n=1 Tax=Lichtheimia ornata TaxID=688661 RepID=A0AAD7UYE2_9FUNG|nr:uncharacterized protein O0I10_009939 [Lichtheimia ornata]KAJ8654371.1 hypothetical protein O0I10_009939 [Lichtheimia ornata]